MLNRATQRTSLLVAGYLGCVMLLGVGVGLLTGPGPRPGSVDEAVASLGVRVAAEPIEAAVLSDTPPAEAAWSLEAGIEAFAAEPAALFEPGEASARVEQIAADAEPAPGAQLPIETIEALKPALLTAEIRAFAFIDAPLPTPTPEPPPAAGCDISANRPPVNPPRVLRADGSALIPSYAEFQDSLGRFWVWDGTVWSEKGQPPPPSQSPC
jgi:hypothetical protein